MKTIDEQIKEYDKVINDYLATHKTRKGSIELDEYTNEQIKRILMVVPEDTRCIVYGVGKYGLNINNCKKIFNVTERFVFEAIRVMIIVADEDGVRDFINGKTDEIPAITEDSHVVRLCLNNTINLPLYRSGITRVGDLTSMTKEELKSVRTIGDAACKKIIDSLASAGFSLKE